MMEGLPPDGALFLSLQNRIRESMNLFSAICNNVFFRSTSMVRDLPLTVLLRREDAVAQTRVLVSGTTFIHLSDPLGPGGAV